MKCRKCEKEKHKECKCVSEILVGKKSWEVHCCCGKKINECKKTFLHLQVRKRNIIGGFIFFVIFFLMFLGVEINLLLSFLFALVYSFIITFIASLEVD